MRSLLTFACLTMLLWAPAQAQSTFANDEAAIRAAVEDYFWGRQNGDQSRLGRALQLEGGDLKGVAEKDGRQTLTVTPLADYLARNTRPRGLPTQGHILALDVTDGKMAWAKVRLDAAARTYTDYLLFYRIDGAWKIVNKMFVAGGPAK